MVSTARASSTRASSTKTSFTKASTSAVDTATANSAKTAKSTSQSVQPAMPGDVTRYTLRALLDEARLLMGQEQALQYRLAAVLRELDQRAHADGSPLRLPRWLHHHFGLGFGAAREKVRTARALGALPAIDAAFRDGQLSYSKVRALTRVATADTEDELLAVARRTSAEGVEHLVRRVKQAECLDDVQAMIASRSLSTRWDDSGALIVHGRLTPEQGEVFLKALARATEVLTNADRASHREGQQTNTAQAAQVAQAAESAENPGRELNKYDAANDDRYWARRADALMQVMGDSLAGRQASTPGDRHQVVVQVAVETLAGVGQQAGKQNHEKNVPAGTLLHPETIRRLACDGGLVTVLTDAAGEPLNVGRKTRAIPPSTRRALVARDRHCQFPGCAQERYVEGHHIVHWAHGGKTRLNNLVLLCSRHHRAVHELGYRIRRSAKRPGAGAAVGRSFEFTKPKAGALRGR